MKQIPNAKTSTNTESKIASIKFRRHLHHYCGSMTTILQFNTHRYINMTEFSSMTLPYFRNPKKCAIVFRLYKMSYRFNQICRLPSQRYNVNTRKAIKRTQLCCSAGALCCGRSVCHLNIETEAPKATCIKKVAASKHSATTTPKLSKPTHERLNFELDNMNQPRGR